MFVFPGFNSNIEHRNRTYHIQTEVHTIEGINKVNTLIYLAGRIFLSVSTELGKEDSGNRETATNAIRRQHNRTIRDLISDQLEAQKESETTEDIDFAHLYSGSDIFTCYGKCFDDARNTYKKLLIMEENKGQV
jgi:hypothetical protein